MDDRQTLRFSPAHVCMDDAGELCYQEAVMLSRVDLALLGALIILPHAAFAADNYPTRSVEIAVPNDRIIGPKTSLPTAYRKRVSGRAVSY
jgi:hypothetical protein